MKHYSAGFVFLFTLALFFSSCTTTPGHRPVIAISKEKPQQYTQNYSGWLNRFEDEITFVELYPLGIDSAIKTLANCDGVVITGGEDVYPDLYGREYDTARCGSFDRYRDSLELAAIKYATNTKTPLIGICRGLQIINVSQGGSLIIDIPKDFDTLVTHRQDDWRNCFHEVTVSKNTLLSEICGEISGAVASNHHQGINKAGENISISTYSADNLPEAIEWENDSGRSFMLAVQWHPERMDTLDPLSAPIAKAFLDEVKKYSKLLP